jgi:hypothetical protein
MWRTNKILSSPLISFLFVLHFSPSEFPFDIFFVCSSLYTFWVPRNRQKIYIKGELRRCKVRNRQTSYQRGTQKVQCEEQTKKISKGNSEGVKWGTDRKDIKGELRTFWVPLWYLFCLFFTLHLLSFPLISFLSVLHFTPSGFPFQSEEQTKKISKGNSEGVKWRTNKNVIKGELRRCKVKNRQKRYQRGTQKV